MSASSTVGQKRTLRLTKQLYGLLGNYDRQTNRPTDERIALVIGKFHFQTRCCNLVHESPS